MGNRAIRYRLYPTTEQGIMLSKTFGCCRRVYNLMLADKREGYQSTGKIPSVTPAMYKKKEERIPEIQIVKAQPQGIYHKQSERNGCIVGKSHKAA